MDKEILKEYMLNKHDSIEYLYMIDAIDQIARDAKKWKGNKEIKKIMQIWRETSLTMKILVFTRKCKSIKWRRMQRRETNILREYLEEIKDSPDILITETVSKKWNSSANQTTGSCITQDTVIRNEILHNKLDHYESLYRCFIEARKVGREKLAVIAITIAATVILAATIFCCAFGPNFKSQESVDTSPSTKTVMVNGYAGHESYGYIYFQESGNGRK